MRLVIVGASGRMGCALVHGSAELPASRVVAGIDRTDSPAVGRDFGELAGLAPLGIVVGSCLDDALSAVDMHTETSILEGLRSRVAGQTRIIVSHRLSAVMDADRIIVLEDGRITQRGTHAELVARGGRYAELVARDSLGAIV